MTDKTEPFEFTVNRSNWIRGVGSEDSGLLVEESELDADGMCCLGFFAKACWLSDDQIRGLFAFNCSEKLATIIAPEYAALSSFLDKL